MINTKLQNIIDTKAAIGNAINNKGGSITAETPFYEYAPAIENISSGGGAYSTWVAQAQDNSKYTVYNGYDFLGNPTPNLSDNFDFNKWILNNSATGDIIFSNVTLENSGSYNGPNTILNESLMLEQTNYVFNRGGTLVAIQSIAINDSFVYVGTEYNIVTKLRENNLAFIGDTVNYGNHIYTVVTNNGFVYAGGNILTGTNRGITKYHENNLVLVSNTGNYGGDIRSIVINNGFIYVGGRVADVVRKYNESTLSLVGSTATTGGDVRTIAINNGFVYAGGGIGSNNVAKFHESNLAFVGNTAVYGGVVYSIAINNGFLYVGGGTANVIRRYNESTLALVNSSAGYGGNINTITIDNGFIYAGGATNQTVQKFYESNFARISNTSNYAGTIFAVAANNGHFFYGGLRTNAPISKTSQANASNDVQTIYNITRIKE